MLNSIIVFELIALLILSLYLKFVVKLGVVETIRFIAFVVLISLIFTAFAFLFTGRLSELFDDVLFLIALLVSSVVALWNN